MIILILIEEVVNTRALFKHLSLYGLKNKAFFLSFLATFPAYFAIRVLYRIVSFLPFNLLSKIKVDKKTRRQVIVYEGEEKLDEEPAALHIYEPEEIEMMVSILNSDIAGEEGKEDKLELFRTEFRQKYSTLEKKLEESVDLIQLLLKKLEQPVISAPPSHPISTFEDDSRAAGGVIVDSEVNVTDTENK